MGEVVLNVIEEVDATEMNYCTVLEKISREERWMSSIELRRHG